MRGCKVERTGLDFTFRACLRAPSSLSFTICSRQPSRYLNTPASWFLSALANLVPCTGSRLAWLRCHHQLLTDDAGHLSRLSQGSRPSEDAMKAMHMHWLSWKDPNCHVRFNRPASLGGLPALRLQAGHACKAGKAAEKSLPLHNWHLLAWDTPRKHTLRADSQGCACRPANARKAGEAVGGHQSIGVRAVLHECAHAGACRLGDLLQQSHLLQHALRISFHFRELSCRRYKSPGAPLLKLERQQQTHSSKLLPKIHIEPT